jgi:hypothetical protein
VLRSGVSTGACRAGRAGCAELHCAVASQVWLDPLAVIGTLPDGSLPKSKPKMDRNTTPHHTPNTTRDTHDIYGTRRASKVSCTLYEDGKFVKVLGLDDVEEDVGGVDSFESLCGQVHACTRH